MRYLYNGFFFLLKSVYNFPATSTTGNWLLSGEKILASAVLLCNLFMNIKFYSRIVRFLTGAYVIETYFTSALL